MMNFIVLSLKENTMLGNVPADWDVKPLKELLAEHYPGDWGDESGPEMFNVIRSTNLTASGHLDLNDIASRALKPKVAEKLQLLRNDLLLERSGGGPGQPVGRVGFVETDLERSAFSNFLHMLRPDPEEVNPRYLGWILWRINQTGRILRLEQQTTQMRNLHFRDYLQMPLPVPPPAEQAAIARILDAVDTAIERVQDAIDRARDLRRSLIDELIVEPSLASSRANKGTYPLRPLGSDIVDGPSNGSYKPESEYDDEGVPIIRIDDFYGGRIIEPARLRRVKVSQNEIARYRVSENELIINRVNSLSHLGKSAIVSGVSDPTLIESNMMRLRIGPSWRPHFLKVVLCSEIARRHWMASAKPAVNQASINQRDVRRLPVPLPEINDQDRIVECIDQAESYRDGLVGKATALADLKRSLMHDLLTGKVRTDQVKLDEVAA